jgi:hypothetical protein
MHRETITRRFLPHWHKPGAAHFVTFRLVNSLPQTVLEEIQQRKCSAHERFLRDGDTSGWLSLETTTPSSGRVGGNK